MKLITIILTLSVAFLSSCSNKLNRDKAKEMIEEGYKLPTARTKTWQVGIVRYLGVNSAYHIQQKQKYIDEGLIEFKFLGNGGCFVNSCIKFSLNFTDKGNKYVLSSKPHISEAEVKETEVKYADMVFGEITGIREVVEGKEAIVGYTLKFDNLTPFGEVANAYARADNKEEPFGTGKIISKNARFIKYDDGWRLSSLNYHSF
ncbi:MAG: hypothetical protein KF706_10825 [Chitinophagales bacterium]|nr:hypothetical protein [Chitinophagales bacterium]